jgi:hypothetical protein
MGIRSLSKWEQMYLYQERHLNYEQGSTYKGEFNYNPTPAFHKQFYNTFKTYTPGAVITPPPPTVTFAIGDRIEVSANTNVRATAALTGSLLGVQPALAKGTIIGGPIGKDANNITWWQIDYDTGVDGWSGQDNFVKITSPPPPPPPPVVTYSIGDRVELANNTNVRSSGALTGTLLGTQVALAKGTIVGGPIGKDANNITWWQMDYDTGVDGWSGQDNFVKIPAVKPSRPTGLKTE